MLAIVVLDGALLTFMHKQNEQELRKELASEAARMTDAAAYSMSSVLSMLRPLASMLANDGTSRELVRQAAEYRMRGEQDALDTTRTTLRNYLQDGWEAWQSEHYFRQLHFIFANGSSLLRMHKPDFHGDDLTELRPMIMDSMARNAPLDGYEFGKLYGGFRAVAPIAGMDSGGEPQVLAALEVGLSGQSVFHNMTEHFGIQAAIILHQDYVTPRSLSDLNG